MLKDQFHIIVLFSLTLVIAGVTVRHDTQFWQGTFMASLSALFIAINPSGGNSSPKP